MLTKTEAGFKLALFIQPKASKNEIIGPHNGALKIKIAAPPVDGQANEALVHFLAKTLGLPKRSLEILKGETGRHKFIEIRDIDENTLKSRLGLIP